MTHFLARKSFVTEGKCVTQGGSVRLRDIPWVTHVCDNCVTSGKFNAIWLNFPEVTQFWESSIVHEKKRFEFAKFSFFAENMRHWRVCLQYFFFISGKILRRMYLTGYMMMVGFVVRCNNKIGDVWVIGILECKFGLK